MEKSRGRVRNFVVTNREVFCDALARKLCQMQIPYVQVENEFHFNDKIYRFFNLSESLELECVASFVNLDKDRIVTLQPQSLLFAKDKEDLGRILSAEQDVVVTSTDITFEDKRKNKFQARQMFKQDNKMIKQKLRNSYRQQGVRTRRGGQF